MKTNGKYRMSGFAAVVLFLGVCSLALGDIGSGLVGWWKLDGDGLDSSMGGHDAELSGGPVYVQGKIGEGLEFDGIDDYAQVAYSSALNLDTFSVACWVKVHGGADTERTIVSSQGIRDGFPGPEYSGYSLGISSSNKWQFSFAVLGGFPNPEEWEQLASNVDALLDTWTHVAVTFRATGIFEPRIEAVRIYVDGVLVASYHDRSQFWPNTLRPLRIGAGSGEEFYPPINLFDGQLDDVRIYGRVLQESEIADLIAIATPVDSPSPSDGATNVNINADLGWSDPRGVGEFYESRYIVYFGTVNPPTEFVGNHNYWDMSHVLGTLDYETTYYWKVDKVTDFGTVAGPIWSFTTDGDKATAPQPANGAAGVGLDTDLSWTPYEGALSHTVYFGTDNPPETVLVEETLDTTIYPATLDIATVYYWRVDENIATGTVTGDVWSFTTTFHGSGSESDPYQISSAEELQVLSQKSGYWNGNTYFVLTNDISVLGVSISPIGNRATAFNGVFDGQGHTITGLCLKGVEYMGLFGHTGANAQIYNLSVLEARIHCTWLVGGVLAGHNEGSITNCMASGAVTGLVDESKCLGILAGRNWGQISNCYATGAVMGATKFSGGLVGSNAVSISNCYTTATVAADNTTAGGLAGYNSGSIINCYVAGIVVDRVYRFGGLVNWNNHGTVSNCFWDKEISEETYSEGGTGKTTAQMRQQATFAGWDFENTWEIVEGQSYPYLKNVGKKSGVKGDNNGDGKVDMKDLAILAANWLEGTSD